MKKQIISMLALTLIQFVAIAAGEKLIVKIEKAQDANALLVQLANLEKIATEIAIQDLDGNVWFSQYIKNQNGYYEKLNLNGMPEGEYLLYVKNKSRLKVQAFSTGKGKITFFETPGSKPANEAMAVLTSNTEKQKANLIARFTNGGNVSLQVQIANLNKQPATIRLVAVGGAYIFEQKVKNEFGYAKNLNLKDIESGDYFLVMEAEGTTVIQLIRIEKNKSLELGTLQKITHPATGPAEGESLTVK